MFLLFPGRHHLLTNYQGEYLEKLLSEQNPEVTDIQNLSLGSGNSISRIIFVITSANHSGTKRNPIPFYLRAIMLDRFSRDLKVPCSVIGVDDVGFTNDFADHTLKQVAHQSDFQWDPDPDNTLVLCSTPVGKMYEKLGYRILPCELKNEQNQEFHAPLPWHWVERIANETDWKEIEEVCKAVHPSCLSVWENYGLDHLVQSTFNDPIIGEDGDLTASRDYNSYVRQMDEIAELKYREAAPFIVSGNIGDIGCAVGSWMKFANEDPRLVESDLYGIEVSRQLFDICKQRKSNGEFKNPNVFFSQKNAVTNLVFRSESMHTIHTSSLTHEIASYGNIDDLKTFIRNRYNELRSGGVWINRDVIGPENGDREIWMWLDDQDGENDDVFETFQSQQDLAKHLNSLSTFSRFKRFAIDFRKEEGESISYEIVEREGRNFIKTKLKTASDYLLTKDYTDNWESEMHEEFCFWSFTDWQNEMQAVGFEVQPGSKAYTNPWIYENRIQGCSRLYEMTDNQLVELEKPLTNVIIIGKRLK